MKTILCYGDSNTWGAPPVIDENTFMNIPRYGMDVRWGSVLRTKLGDGYWVIEEGLNGRTTALDEPEGGSQDKNGKRYLPLCLETHQPLDLVILLLGTNDLQSHFGQSAGDIAKNAGVLAKIVQTSTFLPGYTAPKALLICPPPVGKLTFFADALVGAAEKSRQLAPLYRHEAETYGCEFLDAGQVITSSDRDGIHLEASEQQKLGLAVAERVRQILG
jgi:lysophospholipase L1-like esterase